MNLEITTKASLILLAVATAALLLRGRSAATRHLAQVAGLVAVLVLPALVPAVPSWELPLLDVLATVTEPRAVAEPPASWPSASRQAPRARSSASAGVEPALANPPEAVWPLADERVPAAVSTGSAAGRSVPWLQLLWVAGLLLVLARLGVGWVRMTGLAFDAAPMQDEAARDLVNACAERLGLRRAPRVLVSQGVSVPMLWGFVHPTLFLPESALGWTRDRLRVVLLHELAHLRRRDGLTLLLGRLATAAWWFHPLSWIVDRGARRDCERACDDLVLASGERPSAYAAHLLAIARELPRAPAPAGALAFASTHQLEGRLHSILQPGVRRGAGRVSAPATAVLTALLIVPLASATLVARDAAAAEAPSRHEVAPGTRRPLLTADLERPAAEAPSRHEVTPGTRRQLLTADLESPAAEAPSRHEVAPGTRRQLLTADLESPAAEAPSRHEVTPGTRRTFLTAESRQPAAGDERDLYLLAHESRGHEGEELFERAFELHRAEKWNEAATLFLDAAEAGYRVSTSLYNAACGFARMGDAPRAVEYIDRAIAEGFDNGDLLLGDSDLDPIRADARFRGLLERVRSDRDTSIGRETRDRLEAIHAEYEELVRTNSKDGRDWYAVGSRLLSLREFDDAIRALERAAELLEDNDSALYNLACAYSLGGDSAAALAQLERAVLAGFSNDERFADDTDLDAVRGSAEFERIWDLSEELSLDRFRNRWNWSGDEYSERRWRPAIEQFTAFTESHPTIGRGWSNLGWALHHSRRFSEARAAFGRQRDLDYRPSNATYNIACTHAMEGNADAALAELEKVVAGGGVRIGQMLHDEDLEILHDDPRFQALLERAIEQIDDDDDAREQKRELRRLLEKRQTARLY